MKQITNKELLLFLDESYDGFMVSDNLGTILYSNIKYRETTKLGEKGKPGNNLRELVENNEIDGSSCVECIRCQRTYSSVHIDYAQKGVILCTAKPIFDENNCIKFVITNTKDASDFFNLKNDLEEAHNAIRKFAKSVEDYDPNEKSIIAVSREMRNSLELAKKASNFDVSVLVKGESGVGKEIIAKYIHDNSHRSDKPFIIVNCGAIPEQLLETEMFGYVEGTFTGQRKGGKYGLFAAASGGTMLLDEIGDMPLSMQVKLLRMIETNYYTPVGSCQQVQANVRFISATNKPLKEMIKEGKFREDLYYRLNTVEILVAPLIERKDDIIPLSLFFLKHFNRKYSLTKKIQPMEMNKLIKYGWPGNARELKHVIEMMAVLSQDNYLKIPKYIIDDVSETSKEKNWEIGSLCNFIANQEKDYLTYCYRECRTTRKLAERLEVNHSTIMRKLKRYNIKMK